MVLLIVSVAAFHYYCSEAYRVMLEQAAAHSSILTTCPDSNGTTLCDLDHTNQYAKLRRRKLRFVSQ